MTTTDMELRRATAQGMGRATPREAAAGGQLAEVWGDVVSRRQLGLAIVISVALSLALYQMALLLIVPLASTASIGRALAMLVGVLGCVAAAALCSVLFRPKRVLREAQPGEGSAWQHEVLDQIEAEMGPMGRLEDLPPQVIAELDEIGLLELFRAREARLAAEGAAR